MKVLQRSRCVKSRMWVDHRDIEYMSKYLRSHPNYYIREDEDLKREIFNQVFKDMQNRSKEEPMVDGLSVRDFKIDLFRDSMIAFEVSYRPGTMEFVCDAGLTTYDLVP